MLKMTSKLAVYSHFSPITKNSCTYHVKFGYTIFGVSIIFLFFLFFLCRILKVNTM